MGFEDGKICEIVSLRRETVLYGCDRVGSHVA